MRLHFQLDLFSFLKRRVRTGTPRSVGHRLAAQPISRPKRASPGVKQDPELLQIWRKLQAQYFPEREDLLQYIVFWSTRAQRRVLGSCHLRTRRVRVARELRSPQCLEWLEPLLYHEMCHAVLGVDIQRSSGRRAWHGREFRALESRHPRSAALDAWIRSGGWASAVRSARARSVWEQRRKRV